MTKPIDTNHSDEYGIKPSAKVARKLISDIIDCQKNDVINVVRQMFSKEIADLILPNIWSAIDKQRTIYAALILQKLDK